MMDHKNTCKMFPVEAKRNQSMRAGVIAKKKDKTKRVCQYNIQAKINRIAIFREPTIQRNEQRNKGEKMLSDFRGIIISSIGITNAVAASLG